MINKNFFTSNPSLHKSHYATRQLPTTLVVLRYIRVNTSAVVPLHCLCLYWRFFLARCSQFLCVLPCCTGYIRYTDSLAAWSINTTLLKV